MVALPAVLELKNCRLLPALVMVALPAVLELLKFSVSLAMMVALPPLMTMPAPLKLRVWRKAVVKV